MPRKLDSLGRQIPEFDRSAAGKKSAKKQKDRYGTDYHKRIGANGGRKRGRGFFGKLKDEGKDEELSLIGKKARQKRSAKDKSEGDEY